MPATATLWSKDGALLTSSAADTTVLSDYRSAHYRSTLAISKGMTGIISCDIYSDWVSADNRNSGRQSESATYALMYESGGRGGRILSQKCIGIIYRQNLNEHMARHRKRCIFFF